LVVCIGSYYLYFIFNVRSRFFNDQNTLLDQVLKNSNTTTPVNNSTSLDLGIKSKFINNDNAKIDINKSLNLLNTTLDLSKVSNEGLNMCIDSNTVPTFLKNTHTKVWFITLRNSNYTVTKSINLEYSEFDYVITNTGTDLRLTLNPYLTSKIQKNTQLLPNNLNIINQLSLAKQDRWFLKNSILSDSLIKSTANFTSSKKLITSEILTGNPSNNV
jgi:uncharacterized membrane protein YcgQ (UPF0703/DUF1980 family)